LHAPKKFTQIEIFCLKIYHLATLFSMLAITIFFEGSLCQRRDWAALNPLFLAAMIRQNRRIRRYVFEGVIQDQGDQIGRISHNGQLVTLGSSKLQK
jgi:hypothetical protein